MIATVFMFVFTTFYCILIVHYVMSFLCSYYALSFAMEWLTNAIMQVQGLSECAL